MASDWLPQTGRGLDGAASDIDELFAVLPRQSTVIMVTHAMGGGIVRHIHDLARLCEGQVNVLWMHPAENSRLLALRCLTARNLWSRVELLPYSHSLEAIRSNPCVRRIHIHHAAGYEDLRLLIRIIGKPFDFTIHDFYTLAPEPHLVDETGFYVGDDLELRDKALCSLGTDPSPPVSLQAWQRRNRWLLEDAERVIAPSFGVAGRIQRHYPRQRMVVAAHPGQSVGTISPSPRPLMRFEPFHIVCLGHLTRSKGFRSLVEVAAALRSQPFRFTVIGTVEDPDVAASLGIKVTGGYRDDDLPELIGRADPDLFWVPGTCPETFSYTLTSMLRTGMPIAAPDLGCFPERLAERDWTWIVPWRSDGATWARILVRVREAVLSGEPPAPPPAKPAPTDEFYRGAYLDWVDAYC